MNNSKTAARRLILRSLVLGGSATAASKLLPDTWVTPAINAVVTPAHAQTSVAMITGQFQTVPGSIMLAGVQNSSANQPLFVEEQIQDGTLSVLDLFIKPANAGLEGSDGLAIPFPTDAVPLPADGSDARPLIESCDSVDFANNVSQVQITMTIDQNPGIVSICISTDQASVFASSSINGDAIDSAGANGVSLTSMVITETEITGEIAINPNRFGIEFDVIPDGPLIEIDPSLEGESVAPLTCSSNFSAPLQEGGVFNQCGILGTA